MQKKNFVGCLAILWAFLAAATLTSALPVDKKNIQTLVFDTGIHPLEVYEQPLTVFKKLGWAVSYRSLEGSLGVGLDEVFKFKPNVSIFVINDEFLRSGPDLLVGKFVREALARSAALKGGTTVLMIPSMSNSSARTAMRISPLFNALGLQSFIKEWSGEAVGSFKKAMMRFLTHPLGRRALQYHTSLRMPQLCAQKPSKSADMFIESAEGDTFCSLPLAFHGRFDAGRSVGATLPLGVCFYDVARDHSFIISYASLMTTFGIAEDIQVLPFNEGLQHEFCELVCNFWSDLDIWARADLKLVKNEFVGRIKASVDRMSSLAPEMVKISKKPGKKPVKTAWMELVAFDETGKETRAELAHKRLQQERLVESLLESGLDYAWISLSPQMYYGVHAKCPEKRAIFEAGFVRFAKLFKAEAQRLKRPVPKIMVGFEIANNLYDKHLPVEFSVDLYGNKYLDMPSPCSKLFWEEEIIKPLEVFCRFFIENKLNSFVALGGVVIDCELYGRLHASSFSSLMLCDAQLLGDFCKYLGLAKVPPNFIEWAVGAHKIDDLVAFASSRVRDCASAMKAAINKCIPRPVIACYAPVVSIDWFLSSFCGALGSGDKPFELLTFNTSFNPIRSVVERKFGLKINHSVVLMLSKFCGPQDFALLDQVMESNDGYWFNRWSRFVEPRDESAWHAIEQPGLSSADGCISFYSHIAAH